MQTHIIFIVNLIQDVNILRPLAYLAASEFDVQLGFLVSQAFTVRDSRGDWMREIQTIATDIEADVHIYASPYDAQAFLQRRSGVLIAGSESDLNAHSLTHEIFRTTPSSFLKITMQHGFECVGFLQNREQTEAHGHGVLSAADLLCGWFEADRLTDLAPSERSKLYVGGPPALLQSRPALTVDAPSPGNDGLVCENMHSVRFSAEGDRTVGFIEDFMTFCDQLRQDGRSVTLRPHPGGQYVLKNALLLPDNVEIENRPMYKVDLTRFDFGISAPSTVIFDMLLAGIPVAVWSDADGSIDRSAYPGVRSVHSVAQWLNFAREATANPAPFRKAQAAFLESLGMPLDPSDVRTRYARLLAGAGAPIAVRAPRAVKPMRIMLVANALIPTLHIFFLRPLKLLQERALVELACLTEEMLRRSFADPEDDDTRDWVTGQVEAFAPDLIVFCRYSGPHADAIIATAGSANIPTIYHLDDDLLNIPREIGLRKFRAHNAPHRLASIHTSLETVDLVYCSTPALLDRLVGMGYGRSIVAGSLACSSEVRRRPAYRDYRRIGYMGFDHEHDLSTVLSALVSVMRRHTDVRFELFGSIPKPAVLDEFGDRVTIVPPIRDYAAFRSRFSCMEWDIGICPLADIPFNHLKADIKWAEYTSVGIAVVATAGMIYDDCCADGCGLVASDEQGWIDAIETLLADKMLRHEQVERAQRKLEQDYTLDRLRAQMIEVFRLAGAPLGDELLAVAGVEPSHRPLRLVTPDFAEPRQTEVDDPNASASPCLV